MSLFPHAGNLRKIQGLLTISFYFQSFGQSFLFFSRDLHNDFTMVFTVEAAPQICDSTDFHQCSV